MALRTAAMVGTNDRPSVLTAQLEECFNAGMKSLFRLARCATDGMTAVTDQMSPPPPLTPHFAKIPSIAYCQRALLMNFDVLTDNASRLGENTSAWLTSRDLINI